jgi:hypothetical protein
MMQCVLTRVELRKPTSLSTIVLNVNTRNDRPETNIMRMMMMKTQRMVFRQTRTNLIWKMRRRIASAALDAKEAGTSRIRKLMMRRIEIAVDVKDSCK